VNSVKKININYEVISDEKVICNSKGILNKNEIIFYDQKVKNKIRIFENKIVLERNFDYLLELEFIMGKKTKGAYTIDGNTYEIDIFTSVLEIKKNEILIDYYINKDEKLNFKVKISYEIYE